MRMIKGTDDTDDISCVTFEHDEHFEGFHDRQVRGSLHYDLDDLVQVRVTQPFHRPLSQTSSSISTKARRWLYKTNPIDRTKKEEKWDEMKTEKRREVGCRVYWRPPRWPQRLTKPNTRLESVWETVDWSYERAQRLPEAWCNRWPVEEIEVRWEESIEGLTSGRCPSD